MHKKSTTELAIAILVFCCLFCARISMADDKIYLQLLAEDKKFAQGTLVYEITTNVTVGLVANDQKVNQMRQQLESKKMPKEHVERLLSKFKSAQKAAFPLQQNSYSQTLYYRNDEDLRFARKSKQMDIEGQENVITQIFDGEDELIITNDADGKATEVSIQAGRPNDIDELMRMISLYPGACFVLGRGLSSLSNVKLVNTDADPVVQGEGPDGTAVKAILDAQHGYVAKQIERKDKDGITIGKFLLGIPIRSTDDLWIASSCVYQAFTSDQQQVAKTEYVLQQASFKVPDERVFEFPLRQGLKIIDNRLGKPVVFEKKSLGTITKKELLEATKKQLEEEARLKAASEQAERRESLMRSSGIAMPIFLGALLRIRSRRRLRKKS